MFAEGLFNRFRGGSDLLDDLDDHYMSDNLNSNPSKSLLLLLQPLARDHDVRVTIPGGDVHLVALGCFYSKPELKIPVGQDHR